MFTSKSDRGYHDTQPKQLVYPKFNFKRLVILGNIFIAFGMTLSFWVIKTQDPNWISMLSLSFTWFGIGAYAVGKAYLHKMERQLKGIETKHYKIETIRIKEGVKYER